MATLIVAEKNKAAKAIADSLGSTNTIKEGKYLKVYEVTNKNIYVLPLRGHIFEHQNSDPYKSWTKSNPREIITKPSAIEKVPKSYAYPYINSLKKYARKCNQCVIGTDADIEGCNIGLFDALPVIKRVNKNINVSQMWLSSLQKSEIIDKYKNQISPKWNWGESGEARSLVDAIIGFSATREVTNTLKPLLKQINRKFVSIGRVQTCLLYLIYLREKNIDDFTPIPYFTIDGIFTYDTHQFKGYHENNPFNQKQQQKVQSIYNKIKDEKVAHIVNQSRKKIIKKPPSPLNTSKALILLTKNLHINASLALKVMNDLYLNKIITYPRTDSDIYKPNFKHRELIQKFTNHSDYGNYASNLTKKGHFTPTRGKKDAGDHPPITPLESLELNSSKLKNNLQKKVYDLLARHYLALFGEKAEESKVYLKLSIKNEPFKSSLVSLVSKGFLSIAPFLKRKYSPLIKIAGKTLPIIKIDLNRKETKPPSHYSDTSLLKLMEKNNIGTKSTRPVIIQTLQDRGVIETSKRHYEITPLGRFLIENLIEIWLPFLKPKFTQMIESLLNDIKNGKKSKDEVIKTMRAIFLKLFDRFLANKSKIATKMKNLDTKRFKNTKSNKKRVTSANCPFCKQGKMELITPKNKRRFLVCTNDNCSKKYLSVPKKGRIYILYNSFCSKCGFNIFKIYIRKGNKTFPYFMCPYCWNQGLEENVSGKGFCSNCSNYGIKNNKCIKK